MTYRIDKSIQLLRAVVPDAHAVGTVNGDGLDCQGYDEALFQADVGTMATNATLDLKLQESDDDSTYTDVASGAATQLTQAGGDSNKQARISIACRDYKRYLRLVGVVGTAVVDWGAQAALAHKHGPAGNPGSDPSSLAETVRVTVS